jgi:protein PhnA
MSEFPPCPKCKSPYTYDAGLLLTCPECGYEWSAEKAKTEETGSNDALVVKDSNGAVLQDGDTVVVIKDLPVKGYSKNIKAGTKVKNIRLTDGDHNIDCKVDGFGAMALKSIFVKKA